MEKSKVMQQDNWLKRKIEQAREHQEKAYREVNELVIEARKGKKLILTDGSEFTEFMSCSYLGLDMDSRLIQAATANIEKCGVTFPAARTRARVKSFVVLEDLLNQILCQSHTATFSALHLAHLGCLPLLGSGEMPSFPLKNGGPIFILDKTVHASIQVNRGLLQQFGEVVREDFQQLEQVEKAARKAAFKRQTPILISDSIGSMGGVVAIDKVLEITEHCDGYAYLDDAHGMSIHGRHGCGYVLKRLNHIFHPRLILTTSLAKAFGAVAGVIALPSEADVKMVRRFAPTYVFGGPPPLAIIDSAIASAQIHLSPEITALQTRLWDNVCYFDDLFGERAFNSNLPSPVRGVLIGDEFKAIECALELRKHGILVTTAMYPTVAKGHSLLRIALSSAHTKEDIDRLHQAFKQIAATLLLKKVA